MKKNTTLQDSNVVDITNIKANLPGGEDISSTDLAEAFPAEFDALFARTIPVVLTITELKSIVWLAERYIELGKNDRYDVAINKGLTLFTAFCLCRKLSSFQLVEQEILFRMSPLEVVALNDIVECLEVEGVFFPSIPKEIQEIILFIELLAENSIGRHYDEWTPSHKLAFAFADLYRLRHIKDFAPVKVLCDYEENGICWGTADPDLLLLWCMQKRLDVTKYLDPCLWDFWMDPETGDEWQGVCPFCKSPAGSTDLVCRLGAFSPLIKEPADRGN